MMQSERAETADRNERLYMVDLGGRQKKLILINYRTCVGVAELPC